MSYRLRLNLYLLTAALVALALAVALGPLGRGVNIALAIVAAYLAL